GPAVSLDLSLQPGVERAQAGLHVLRVGLVGSGGEAHQVAEQDGDDLALLDGRPGLQGRAAEPAEPEPLGVLPTARRAGHDGRVYGRHRWALEDYLGLSGLSSATTLPSTGGLDGPRGAGPQHPPPPRAGPLIGQPPAKAVVKRSGQPRARRPIRRTLEGTDARGG